MKLDQKKVSVNAEKKLKYKWTKANFSIEEKTQNGRSYNQSEEDQERLNERRAEADREAYILKTKGYFAIFVKNCEEAGVFPRRIFQDEPVWKECQDYYVENMPKFEHVLASKDVILSEQEKVKEYIKNKINKYLRHEKSEMLINSISPDESI